MKTEHPYSGLIYEFFHMRLRFGYYKYGDTLPSIDTLCRAFNVGVHTVKAALRRLRSEGYISMHNGQNTKVVFRQTEQGIAGFALDFFSERLAVFPDLCGTVELVSIPLLVEGLRRTKESDFAHLSRYVERAGSDDLLYFFCYILQKLENPLAMNLFWEISLFMGFTFIGKNGGDHFHNRAVMKNAIEEMIAYWKAQDWDGLRDALIRHQKDSMEMAMQHIRKHVRLAENQTPFVWRIYRDRPQLCYSLAIRMLHEIYWGEYYGAQYLPSYEKLAKKYGVSVSTIRRTIHVLDKVGAVEPVNGIGVRVFSVDDHCNPPDFSDPALRRNLANYFQSFEMLLFSCEEVTRMALEALTEEARGELIDRLEEYLHTGRSPLSLWRLLICAAEYSPLQGVREIYAKIYGLFLWGYPLKASLPETEALDQASVRFTETMIRHLKAGAFTLCATTVKKHLTLLFPIAEQYLISRGIQPDELRVSPAIRLLLIEE